MNPFPQVAPDFGDPLGLLCACHGRIAGHCDTLMRLLPHIAAHGADTQAREAMARIQRYFSTAAQHHHEDEEQDLFSLLWGREAGLDELMATLEREHGMLAQHWAALHPFLAHPDQAARVESGFPAVATCFAESYLAHAEKENGQLFPAASRLLNPEELKRLGHAMARRRGIAQ